MGCRAGARAVRVRKVPRRLAVVLGATLMVVLTYVNPTQGFVGHIDFGRRNVAVLACIEAPFVIGQQATDANAPIYVHGEAGLTDEAMKRKVGHAPCQRERRFKGSRFGCSPLLGGLINTKSIFLLRESSIDVSLFCLSYLLCRNIEPHGNYVPVILTVLTHFIWENDLDCGSPTFIPSGQADRSSEIPAPSESADLTEWCHLWLNEKTYSWRVSKVLHCHAGEAEDRSVDYRHVPHRDVLNLNPRPVAYGKGISGDSGLLAGCEVGAGCKDGSDDSSPGGGDPRQVGYSPMGALGALVLFIAGIVASDRAVRRNGPAWMLYCGWLAGALGFGCVLYVLLWWVWAP